MDINDFEGTIVLEKLAHMDKVDEFMAAVDSDDTDKATELIQQAGINDDTISVVLEKMQDPFDEG